MQAETSCLRAGAPTLQATLRLYGVCHPLPDPHTRRRLRLFHHEAKFGDGSDIVVLNPLETNRVRVEQVEVIDVHLVSRAVHDGIVRLRDAVFGVESRL